jgi:ATP-dependent helicase/nuclease subunit A
MDWTKEQREIIAAEAPNLVVSASAGSGKTTTMIARIVQILAVGNSSIDELLVLTFTNESAKDMRKKLRAGLEIEISNTDDENKKRRLRRQLLELPSASIGTFHHFCSDVVRAWFTVAEAAPNFGILDAAESAPIKDGIFGNTVAECYNGAKAKAAIDMFASARNLNALRDAVYKLHAFLETREDKDEWLRTVAAKCYEEDIDKNTAVDALIRYYKNAAAWYRERFINFGADSPQIQYVVDIVNAIMTISCYDDARGIAAMPDFPRLRPGESDGFKELRTKFKEKIFNKMRETFSKSKVQVTEEIKKDRDIVNGLLLLVRDFMDKYSAKKQELKKMDFADLEKQMLKILGNADALESIRKKYKYIFVDEGQDTNPVQFKIVEKLRGDDKFFYMVGDIKQSIYGFRGCEPDMFENMTAKEFMHCLRLNSNFRSDNAILNFVNAVFAPLMKDYDEKHRFVLPPGGGGIGSAVQIDVVGTRTSGDADTDGEPDAAFDRIDAQTELIYRYIADMKMKVKNIAYSDIAILAENATHFDRLSAGLRSRGVACAVDRPVPASQLPEIAVMNNFLFAAANPTNDLMLVLSMKSVFNFTNDDLAKIKVGSAGGHFIDYIKKYTESGADVRLKAKLKTMRETLSRYNAMVRVMTAAEVLTVFTAEYDGLSNGNTDAFIAKVKGMYIAESIARYLYLTEHDLLKIEINAPDAQNAVRIMTIHGSKGLEFPAVILFDAGDLWSRHGGKTAISVDKEAGVCVLSADMENYTKTDSVLRLGVEKKLAESRRQEKIRLLYVALTRAKNRLYIVGTQHPAADFEPKCMLDLIGCIPHMVDIADIDITIPPDICVTGQETEPCGHCKAEPLKYADEDCDTLVKQSVTALSAAETGGVRMKPWTGGQEDNEAGGIKYGTDFHKKMQYGTSGNGDAEAAAKIIGEHFAGYAVYKELPFLYKKDRTLVQGIVDLLAVKGGEAVIVDYKTTRAGEEEVRTKYTSQLRLYASAVAAALPDCKISAFIYSTRQRRLIAVLL